MAQQQGWSLIALLLILAVAFLTSEAKPQKQRQQAPPQQQPLQPSDIIAQTNLLFIIFDDLRPELRVYGKEHMITPNFDRLARRSVVFDSVYSQVAVCNPSRDSLLTGLRPDTLGNYAFQASFRPHLTFLTQLARSGYRTNGYGKVMHWDGNDREVWTGEQYWGEWYDNQNREWDNMKSTVWPDKLKNLTSYYDYDFASRAIANLRKQATLGEYFATAIGFKLPHTLLHFPHAYFDMYRHLFADPDLGATSAAVANSTSRTLTSSSTQSIAAAAVAAGKHLHTTADAAKRCQFPPTTPTIAYRCCAGEQFRYMNGEGTRKSTVQKDLKVTVDLDKPLPLQMTRELQWGYAAAITFVDTQLGRVLDALDELNLWKNLTIVLTADHGMHNGEKGIWEKWTLFDESTRVPLMIHHPLSPFQGQHYPHPVELVDVFPTVIDLLNPPYDRENVYNAPRARHPRKPAPLSGKSLAPCVLGLHLAPYMWSFRAANVSKVESYYLPGDGAGVGVDEDGGEDSTSSSSRGGNGDGSYSSSSNSSSSSGDSSRNLLRESQELQREAALKRAKRASKGKAARSTLLGAGLSSTAGGTTGIGAVMPRHKRQFAISQIWRCSPKVLTALDARNATHMQTIKTWYRQERREERLLQWLDCDLKNTSAAIEQQEDSFMGYSLRSATFRYTLWLPFDRGALMPAWQGGAAKADRARARAVLAGNSSDTGSSVSVRTSSGQKPSIGFFAEELYDHRGDGWAASKLGQQELVNLASNPLFFRALTIHRQRLLLFLHTDVVFKAALPPSPWEIMQLKRQRERAAWAQAKKAASAAATASTATSAKAGAAKK